MNLELGSDEMDHESRCHRDEGVNNTAASSTQITTGIEGLDEILDGGLLRGYMYVVEGHSGTGKTTLGLQFLIDGRARHESCLLITTAETRDELAMTAQSYGWSLAGIELLELSQVDIIAQPEQRQTVFRSSQLELDEITRTIVTELERVQPARVVLDSVSVLRDMASEPFVYRRHILSLKNALTARGCTALVTDEWLENPDLHLRTLAHGVVRLTREVMSFGNQQRQMEIVKLRGLNYRSGRHDMRLDAGGMRVFPRFTAPSHLTDDTDYTGEFLSTGVEGLDGLLGGGLDRSTAVLIMGTTGTGKSSIAIQCVAAALQRGQSVAVYLFDERPATWYHRAEQLGGPLRQHVTSGTLWVQHINPAEMSPAQFAYELQQAVTQHSVELIIIDSLTGYVNAMPEERFLTLHLHDMLTWLGQRGATTLMVLNQHGLFEPSVRPPIDLSYLCDTLLLLRFFEYRGALHRALSVVKRRSRQHEHTIREMTLGPSGLTVGEPLRQFRGVLSGLPLYEGDHPSGPSR
jgi:circadian clock protein KaiC